MKTLQELAWDEFHRMSLGDKAPLLMSGGRPYHVLFAQQFHRPHLDALGLLTTQIRFIAKSHEGRAFLHELMAYRRAMLYFSQPSSRTFLSFCAACQILGLSIGEVRDTATSSEFKGESHEDSVRTFSSYFDLIVMRSAEGGLAERMAWMLSNTERPVPIINAGSGRDQHPTQSLLDIYTLQRSFQKRGGVDGKRIVFVGDLLRGRTVRSLSSLLTNYRDVTQCFVAPEPFQVQSDVLQRLDDARVRYELSTDFASMIPGADAIYMTRVQDEWDTQRGDSARVDVSKYCFTTEHLRLLKSDAVLMHPFPRRHEIATDVDRDPRAVYWRQMRNGMWIRAALIATIFGHDQEIQKFYEEHRQSGE